MAFLRQQTTCNSIDTFDLNVYRCKRLIFTQVRHVFQLEVPSTAHGWKMHTSRMTWCCLLIHRLLKGKRHGHSSVKLDLSLDPYPTHMRMKYGPAENDTLREQTPINLSRCVVALEPTFIEHDNLHFIHVRMSSFIRLVLRRLRQRRFQRIHPTHNDIRFNSHSSFSVTTSLTVVLTAHRNFFHPLLRSCRDPQCFQQGHRYFGHPLSKFLLARPRTVVRMLPSRCSHRTHSTPSALARTAARTVLLSTLEKSRLAVSDHAVPWQTMLQQRSHSLRCATHVPFLLSRHNWCCTKQELNTYNVHCLHVNLPPPGDSELLSPTWAPP